MLLWTDYVTSLVYDGVQWPNVVTAFCIHRLCYLSGLCWPNMIILLLLTDYLISLVNDGPMSDSDYTAEFISPLIKLTDKQCLAFNFNIANGTTLSVRLRGQHDTTIFQTGNVESWSVTVKLYFTVANIVRLQWLTFF